MLLDVNGIEVIYNHVILVLKGVSLQVRKGSVVALLGGNGAGKTTTLRAVSNLRLTGPTLTPCGPWGNGTVTRLATPAC